MSHRFKLNQHVRMTLLAARDAHLFKGDLWEVVRLMPADQTGEPFYRVRCNGVERAAGEHSLQPA